MTAGTSYSITWPSNVIVPDGTISITDVWWDSSVVVATVTTSGGTSTWTLTQGMADLFIAHGTPGNPYFEYLLTTKIPGVQFVDQASLIGTVQTITITPANSNTLSDSILITGVAPTATVAPSETTINSVSINEGIIATDGTFTISAITHQVPGIPVGTSQTITFPSNIIVPDGSFPIYDVWWDTSVVVANVTVLNNVATITVAQGMADLVSSHNWFEYYAYPKFPGATFVDQATLGGTTQTDEFTTSNGGPFSHAVFISADPVTPTPEALYFYGCWFRGTPRSAFRLAGFRYQFDAYR